MGKLPNEEILEKAIQKAIDRGWDGDHGSCTWRFDGQFFIHNPRLGERND